MVLQHFLDHIPSCLIERSKLTRNERTHRGRVIAGRLRLRGVVVLTIRSKASEDHRTIATTTPSMIDGGTKMSTPIQAGPLGINLDHFELSFHCLMVSLSRP